ncbi:MAG: hypothetical protein HUJ25_12645 [Crocinitomicaceae bacterium]|nr:hypothetical protein [Crocinitomicaceae bacterium]
MVAIRENTENRIITDKFEGYWFDKDTLYLRYYEGVDITLADVEVSIQFQKKQGLNTDHCRIIHAEKYVTISKEAREYVQDNAPTVKADAYVVPSLPLKIIFNLYSKLRKNTNPIKAFDYLEDALSWLKKM